MGQGEDTSMLHFISWNEFYHDMLAKGEVIYFFFWGGGCGCVEKVDFADFMCLKVSK